MSRFGQELRVIPRAAWIVAVVLYLAATTPLFFYVLANDPEIGKWPVLGRAAVAYGPLLVLFILPLLIGYVYGDAKRRGMRYVMWTLLAILIPDGIGVILYFVLRDPMPRPCPGCKALVKRGHTFCPNCGTAVQPTCPNCGTGVEFAWMNCPHCGTKLPSQTPQAA